jgi:hypothetical protein
MFLNKKGQWKVVKKSIIVLTCHCHELLDVIVMMVDRPVLHNAQSRLSSAVATSEYQIMHEYQASVHLN